MAIKFRCHGQAAIVSSPKSKLDRPGSKGICRQELALGSQAGAGRFFAWAFRRILGFKTLAAVC